MPILVKSHKRKGRVVKAHARKENKAKKNTFTESLGIKTMPASETFGGKNGPDFSAKVEKLQRGRALQKIGSPVGYPVTDSGLHHKINRKGAASKRGLLLFKAKMK